MRGLGHRVLGFRISSSGSGFRGGLGFRLQGLRFRLRV